MVEHIDSTEISYHGGFLSFTKSTIKTGIHILILLKGCHPRQWIKPEALSAIRRKKKSCEVTKENKKLDDEMF